MAGWISRCYYIGLHDRGDRRVSRRCCVDCSGPAGRRPSGLINALLSAFRETRNKLADENYANDVGQEAAAAGRGRDASDDEVNRWRGVVQGAERRPPPPPPLPHGRCS